MKLFFLVLAIFINFFNNSLLKSGENIDSKNNKIENIAKEESIAENKNRIRKIHIVKIGDTVSSISKLYSINKDLIIELNNLKDKDYIYVGQNLIVSESAKNSIQQADLRNNYHIVQIGENLTDISKQYKLNLEYLIEVNNLKNPDTLKIGEKILLNNQINSENYRIIKNKKNNELLELDKPIYGPIIIQSKSYEKIKQRKVFNVLNQENKNLILSINCDTNELDVRIPGRKWRGAEPATQDFEKKLINDFC